MKRQENGATGAHRVGTVDSMRGKHQSGFQESGGNGPTPKLQNSVIETLRVCPDPSTLQPRQLTPHQSTSSTGWGSQEFRAWGFGEGCKQAFSRHLDLY